MPRLIKRYGNRKLYDTQESRYVTLEDVAALVKAGEDVQVVDNESGEDLTAVTFAQIILEGERRRNGLLPLAALRSIIAHGGEALQELARGLDRGMEAIGSIREKAGQQVQQLVGRGVQPGKVLEELVTASQRKLESLQREFDERVKESVGRLASLPGVRALQKEIARIERSLRRLEERLGKLRSRSEEPPKSPPDDEKTASR
jgi:polyhydroxyalkanoate synthesis repressor PhaR